MMKYLIDLDEVVVNCNGPIFEHYGVVGKVGEWEQIPGVTEDEIHKYIGRHEFWANLPKMPWADDLIALISETTDEWSFLSYPTKYYESWSGKAEWIDKNYPQHFDRLILARQKFRCASRQHCLIDDRKQHCTRFERVGGTAIPFPSINGHYNWRPEDLADPVKYIKKCLNRIETQRIVRHS